MFTRLKTDRQILSMLHRMYRDDYPAKGDPFLQIDVHEVARKLKMPPELLFGRLYYDMGTRFRVRDPNDPKNTLASVYDRKVGARDHCINFPYVDALLATMQSENRRNWTAVVLSVVAVAVSIAAAWIQYATAKP